MPLFLDRTKQKAAVDRKFLRASVRNTRRRSEARRNQVTFQFREAPGCFTEEPKMGISGAKRDMVRELTTFLSGCR